MKKTVITTLMLAATLAFAQTGFADQLCAVDSAHNQSATLTDDQAIALMGQPAPTTAGDLNNTSIHGIVDDVAIDQAADVQPTTADDLQNKNTQTSNDVILSYLEANPYTTPQTNLEKLSGVTDDQAIAWSEQSLGIDSNSPGTYVSLSILDRNMTIVDGQ